MGFVFRVHTARANALDRFQTLPKSKIVRLWERLRAFESVWTRSRAFERVWKRKITNEYSNFVLYACNITNMQLLQHLKTLKQKPLNRTCSLLNFKQLPWLRSTLKYRIIEIVLLLFSHTGIQKYFNFLRKLENMHDEKQIECITYPPTPMQAI